MTEQQDQTGNPKSSSCPSCVQLQHDLAQQAQALEAAKAELQAQPDWEVKFLQAESALADARRELEDQTGWRRTVEARLVQVIRERDAAREALKAALDALPDSRTAGPDGTGYRYAWDEVTSDEQEWVKGVRANIQKVL